MSDRAPTMQDVATRAGVSMATTSRVLSGGEIRVRPDTRERVVAAAASIGYVRTPRQRGRVLRRVHQGRRELRMELAVRLAAEIARLTAAAPTRVRLAEIRGLRTALAIVAEDEP